MAGMPRQPCLRVRQFVALPAGLDAGLAVLAGWMLSGGEMLMAVTARSRKW